MMILVGMMSPAVVRDISLLYDVICCLCHVMSCYFMLISCYFSSVLETCRVLNLHFLGGKKPDPYR